MLTVVISVVQKYPEKADVNTTHLSSLVESSRLTSSLHTPSNDSAIIIFTLSLRSTPIFMKYLRFITMSLSLSHQALARMFTYQNALPTKRSGDLVIRTNDVKVCKLILHTDIFASNAFIQTRSKDQTLCTFTNVSIKTNVQTAPSPGSTTYVVDKSKDNCLPDDDCSSAKCCEGSQCVADVCQSVYNHLVDVSFGGKLISSFKGSTSISDCNNRCHQSELCNYFTIRSTGCEVYSSITDVTIDKSTFSGIKQWSGSST